MSVRASGLSGWLDALHPAPFARLRLLAVCCVLAIIAGVMQGQDANWDLKNYHYYNPYAWLNNRLDLDIAPAQLQTWHNPLQDLPYYGLVRMGAHSVLMTAVLSLPAGIAIFFLALLAGRLTVALATGLPLFLLLLLALTGASGRALVGTTMSEWHLCALFLFAIICLIEASSDGEKHSRRLVLLAGLAGGAAVGLKLTGMPFAFALAVMSAVLPGNFRSRFERLLILGIGGSLGCSLTFGLWAYGLYHHYGSPLFPYFNDVFHAPLAPDASFRDTRFTTKSWFELISLPYRMATTNINLVSESTMRDWRLLLCLPAACLCWYRAPQMTIRRLWLAISAFMLTAYVLWAQSFGIYRYAGTLECLATLTILAAAVVAYPRRRVLVIFIVALLVAYTTHPARWGRAPHGRPAVLANVPPLPPHSMVVIATIEPVSYIVPSLPAEVPVVAVINNFLRADELRPALQKMALDRVRSHRGPIFLLFNRGMPDEKYYDGRPISEMLVQMGIQVDRSACLPISSGMNDRQLALCPLTVTEG